MKSLMKQKSIGSFLIVGSLLTFSLAQAKEKIVGGERVKDLKEAPFMVSLSGACGGSIISSRWVLTAAHCAGYFSEVKGGILNLREQGIKFAIKRVIKHPKYNSSTLSNDFALVELKEAIDFSTTNLRPVKLATPSFEDEGYQAPGIDSTVFGFGDIGERQTNYKKDLNKVVVPIVSQEEANSPESYNGEIDETMLAAGYAGGGKDSCQGDSGGPLVVYDQQNEPVQVGVVSWGEGCAGPDKYGIYSKVSSGHSWIMATTGLR
jgi:trypsin